MKDNLSDYLNYLKIERQCSALTITSYKSELDRFFIYLLKNNTDIHDCTTSSVRSYVYIQKEKRKLSNVSVCKTIAVLKSFFNYLEDEEYLPVNPTRKIKIAKKEIRSPKLISKYEVEKILNNIKYAPARCAKNYIRDSLIIAMLYYTGIRKSELLNLNWDDLNLERNTLIIKAGKGRKDRIIPMHPRLIELIDKYLQSRLPLTNPALFIGENKKRLSKNSFVNIIKMYLRLSGLENKGYTPHSFRHSFATNLVESGVDIFKVQTLLGHSSLDSTKIYINFNSVSIAKAISNL